MSSTREARVYRVNAWREIKGRPALTFAEPALRGWWQLGLFGKATRDYSNGKKWDYLAKQSNRWLRDPHWVVGEVKTALRRSTSIPPTNSLRTMFPPLAPKVMAKWRKTDPRPTPTTFYDGQTDYKRLVLPSAQVARKQVA